MPFKLVGAPWIDAHLLTRQLNEQKLPGVQFQPFYYRPFFGKFKLENCQGVRILITDESLFLPFTTQYTILGVVKRLYPKEFKEALLQLEGSKVKRGLFDKLNGDAIFFHLLKEEEYFIWKARSIFQKAREEFAPIRKKYLISEYN